MERHTAEELTAARQTIAAIMDRCEKAQAKFAPGTSQYTLQVNRIAALRLASGLLATELGEGVAYEKQALEKALAPLASLISKSEKAREKLAPGSWQHTMLCNNLHALHIASPLLDKALADIEERNP